MRPPGRREEGCRSTRSSSASSGGAAPMRGNKVAQTSASWLSGGLLQRQVMPLMPQAASSFAQPRPISHLGCAVRPYRSRFPHGAAPAAHTRGSSGERARSRRWWWRLRRRGRPSALPPWRTTAAVPRRQIAPRVEGASAHTSASISLSASASSGSPPRQVSGAASRSRVPHSSRKRRTWCIRTLSTWTWTQCTSSLGAPVPSAARAPSRPTRRSR